MNTTNNSRIYCALKGVEKKGVLCDEMQFVCNSRKKKKEIQLLH